jgi:L-aspartate oxidase
MKANNSDFLVLGGGLAGLMLAEKLSRLGTVSVLVKRDLRTCSTGLAQGGIAAVTAAADSFERHAEDTMRAGAGLCDGDIVEMTVREGPARVKELLELGVKFSRAGKDFDLGLEGGHSARRVLHCGDYTGRDIQEALLAACAHNKKVHIYERHPAIDFILEERPHSCHPAANRCLGAYALDERTGRVETFTAGQTFLASGGAGKVYRYTSNPDTATGDGMAMAWRPAWTSPTWNSSSSTPPACTTRRRSPSWYPRRCAAKAAFSHWQGASASCRSITRTPNWPPAT